MNQMFQLLADKPDYFSSTPTQIKIQLVRSGDLDGHVHYDDTYNDNQSDNQDKFVQACQVVY
jgi:hypothetical protein